MLRDDEQAPAEGSDDDGIVINWQDGFEPYPDDDDPPPPSDWNGG